MLSDTNARLAAARRLTSRRGRRETGRFLAEGPQAVREALAQPGLVLELFATDEAIERHRALLTATDLPVDVISSKAAAALSETITPQGVVAVCARLDLSLDDALRTQPELAVILVEANDPGNAGTILRTADAAGAQLVVFAGDSVDPYNGKAVRASAGSLFHLSVSVVEDPLAAIRQCRSAGLLTLATTGSADDDLDGFIDSGRLATRTAWLFGNEARGLDSVAVSAADAAVRIPIHGRAESLNLAAAAAVCLYASARAQRR